MNLSSLSDQRLLMATRELAAREREILILILHHLHEIESRRLYSDLKYSSLFDYAVRELKYSEGQAGRRIQAMRAMAAVPEIEEKISAGELSLSNVAMVQTAFFKSGRTLDRQAALKAVEGLSTREAEKVLGKPKRDLTLDMIDDEVLREKAKKVMGKYAHSKLSLEGVLHKLFDRELQPQRTATPAPERKSSWPTLRKHIFNRDRSCVNCGTSRALQVDHVVPRSLGGYDHPSNLRLLCRACNQRAALLKLGTSTMAPYLHLSNRRQI